MCFMGVAWMSEWVCVNASVCMCVFVREKSIVCRERNGQQVSQGTAGNSASWAGRLVLCV